MPWKSSGHNGKEDFYKGILGIKKKRNKVINLDKWKGCYLEQLLPSMHKALAWLAGIPISSPALQQIIVFRFPV